MRVWSRTCDGEGKLEKGWETVLTCLYPQRFRHACHETKAGQSPRGRKGGGGGGKLSATEIFNTVEKHE